MLLKLIEDLRFFIGAFFLIIGALLVFQSFANPGLVEGYNLNLITGISFLAFALAALALAFIAVRKNALMIPL
jgi:uncharacterized membrane protein HdeD (DUF308 family)